MRVALCIVPRAPHLTPPPFREEYDVVLLSPRNYFLYTPLLPAVAAGSMEVRSIVTPVRKVIHGKVGGAEALACQCVTMTYLMV